MFSPPSVCGFFRTGSGLRLSFLQFGVTFVSCSMEKKSRRFLFQNKKPVRRTDTSHYLNFRTVCESPPSSKVKRRVHSASPETSEAAAGSSSSTGQKNPSDIQQEEGEPSHLGHTSDGKNERDPPGMLLERHEEENFSGQERPRGREGSPKEEQKETSIPSQGGALQEQEKQTEEKEDRKPWTEPNYECFVCQKSFAKRRLFSSHLRTHTGEKPHKCPHCDMSFVYQSEWKIHVRLHTGKKPYECYECGKVFRRKAQLYIHERIHTGEKPYKCSVCEKAFTQSSILIRHEIIHTGEKTYKCSLCGRPYNNPGNLERHIKYAHRNETL